RTTAAATSGSPRRRPCGAGAAGGTGGLLEEVDDESFAQGPGLVRRVDAGARLRDGEPSRLLRPHRTAEDQLVHPRRLGGLGVPVAGLPGARQLLREPS